MEWLVKDKEFWIYCVAMCGYVLMCFISASVLFWCLPRCLKKCNLDLKGDLLRAYVRPPPKKKPEGTVEIENLDEHDANSWECGNEIDKDNLASSKFHASNMGVSKNNHLTEINPQKRHEPERTAEKFHPDLVAVGDVVVEIELEESIKESDGKDAGMFFMNQGTKKYEIMDESHDQLRADGGGQVEFEVEIDMGRRDGQEGHDAQEWRA
jgi:hypothetical protein